MQILLKFSDTRQNFRKVPPEAVRAELERKKDIFDLHRGKKYFINFEDDNLLIDKDYFFNIIDIFTDFFSEFTELNKILFSAENGLDYNLLTKDLCGKLIERISGSSILHWDQSAAV